MQDIEYKNKYLKYKEKYIFLKNNIQNGGLDNLQQQQTQQLVQQPVQQQQPIQQQPIQQQPVQQQPAQQQPAQQQPAQQQPVQQQPAQQQPAQQTQQQSVSIVEKDHSINTDWYNTDGNNDPLDACPKYTYHSGENSISVKDNENTIYYIRIGNNIIDLKKTDKINTLNNKQLLHCFADSGIEFININNK